LINQGNGTFSDQTSQLLPQTLQNDYWTTHIFFSDLQNNGVFDLIVQPNWGAAPSAPLVYLNDGTGHFAVAGTFGNPGDIITPVLENGRTDFVAVSGNGAGVIYKNTLTNGTKGDVTGDGIADVLWQNPSTGEVGCWKMGGSSAQWMGIGTASPTVKIAGEGDFNGNGISDILWQNPTNNLVGA
jgi:hypothetical protein